MTKLALLLAGAVWLQAQGLDPSALLKPPTDTWPSYNGDYTGRRYSTLSQINQTNAGSLAMAWAFQTHQQAIKSTPLLVNGILYFTVPNHVWAVDARTGRQVWHFQRQSAGNMIGQRALRCTGTGCISALPTRTSSVWMRAPESRFGIWRSPIISSVITSV